MSDWLMSDDSDGNGYLGLDDPAMPDAAPMPPSAPVATGGDADWLGADSSSNWLGDDASNGGSAAPQGGYVAGGSPVMDSQGDWFGGNDTAPAPAVGYDAPMAMAPAPSHDAYASSSDGTLTVTSPMLQTVQGSPRALGSTARASGELSNLVLDVEVQVDVGLGNAALTVEEFLEMGRGSVVELDTPIDAPIELRVRGKLIATGQLVSINGSYGMRIIEMVNEEH